MREVPNSPSPTPKKKTRVFVGSSSEAVKRGIVDKLVAKMANDFDVRPWHSSFTAGYFTVEILLQEMMRADAAVLVFAQDDERDLRGEVAKVTRDNVVLEYGLFVARLGRNRVWILEEKGIETPTDLLGITKYQFRPEEGAGQDADLNIVVSKMATEWAELPALEAPDGEIADSGLGFARTLQRERAYIDHLASAFKQYAHEHREVVGDPIDLDSGRAATRAYSEALDLVKNRFWTTTFLSSGFWTRQNPGIVEANRKMLERLRQSGGSARRLFLLDQEPGMVAEAYKRHRILQRQLEKYDELRQLDSDFRNLKSNIRQLVGLGFEIRVAFDAYQAFQTLPQNMLPDPLDCEVAIYDDFRVDVFEGGKLGVITRLRSYARLLRNFEGYRAPALDYFEQLWENADPIDDFFTKMQSAVNAANAKIDYQSNWLAIYEFALEKPDEDLKTIEIKRVEEVLRERGRWGTIRRYLDIGTCTGRYPIQLAEAVKADGTIIGVDEDYDCVRFARSNLNRLRPEDKRIRIEQADFSSDDRVEVDYGSDFDLITCMLGTLSHFGWDRKDSPPFDDSLQRGLARTERLLAPDGVLILGTWSKWACENQRMLSIYSDSDRKRLARWTPSGDELRERVALAGLRVVEQVKPEQRLDVTICAR